MTQLTVADIHEICADIAGPNADAPKNALTEATSHPSAAVASPEEVVAAVEGALELPPGLVERIVAALRHTHVRLMGPPGTGKSTLAKTVLQAYQGENYVFALATGQWSGEDIIGGPVPDPNDPQRLVFQPGLVLSAADAGKWVGIDEMNRADIDAAFGELFGLLAGQDIELPYFSSAGSGSRVKIHARRPVGALDEGQYGLPPEWRMIATMNSWDKASLNRVSFAFSRRWCTVLIPVPDSGSFRVILDHLFQRNPDADDPGVRAALEHLFVAKGTDEAPTLRSLDLAMGAGIARSCVIDISEMRRAGLSPAFCVAQAIEGFLLPQFEGALEHHDQLEVCLRLALTAVGADDTMLGEIGPKLAVFTGRRLGTLY